MGAAKAADQGSLRRPGYRRSAGTPRGEARRRELLDRVVDDLAVNGLVDFSLRRAARAAGTTHKVLLYHFDGADDLLRQAIWKLRERRIANSLTAADQAQPQTLTARVRAIWPALVGEESRVLDQAIGLMMYDSDRYVGLGRGASQQYMPALLSVCPPDWPEQRKLEVSELILAALRGFLIDRLTSGDTAGVEAGFEALARALDREEAALDLLAGQDCEPRGSLLACSDTGNGRRSGSAAAARREPGGRHDPDRAVVRDDRLHRHRRRRAGAGAAARADDGRLAVGRGDRGPVLGT